MRIAVVLLACLVLVLAEAAGPPPQHCSDTQRIVGGSLTTINEYPFGVAVLYSGSITRTTFLQGCGGSILNQRSVLTAGHCIGWDNVTSKWRSRVGSSWANSGGVVHLSSQLIIHPQYDVNSLNYDLGILRLSSNIQYVSGIVAPGRIAGPNYNLGDNQALWAIGWGRTSAGAPSSAQIRHVQVWTVNQEVCFQRYITSGYIVTANMLCSGWLDVGSRGQCQCDSGGPVLHNDVIVGVTSWVLGCGDPYFPNVNARISTASNWIQANA